MPRIISDELFDSLMQCVSQQRLLGVMGKLEQCQREAVLVWDLGNNHMINGHWLEIPKLWMEVIESEKEANGGPETNNN